jgi:flagellar motor switch protein FliM
MDPLKGNAILEIDPAITFSIIDRLFGGSGEGTKVQHELTDIETSVMEGIIVRILGNMREAWTTVIDLRPRLGQIDTNPQFAQIVAPNEMVVLVTLETKVGDIEGMMNFCIPYVTIEPIVSKLSAQYWYTNGALRRTSAENVNIMTSKLAPVDVDVVAEIGHIDMPIHDILSLHVGDVIRLYNTKVGDPFSLDIGNRQKFLCRPGILGKKMAVQVVKKTAEVEKTEVEDLAQEGEEIL